MPVIASVVTAFAALVLAFAAVWAWQLKTANAGMVDPVWAAMLSGVALLYGAFGTGALVNRKLVALCGLLWGLRLAAHLWRRNHGKPEDVRYRHFRQQWGAAANRKMFWFFQLQAIVSIVLSLAFLVPSYRSTPATPGWIAVAVTIWIISVAGEALADRQLRDFTAAPANRGKTCRVGLWRYSRHPNYFFECVHWVAYVALSIGTPWGWLTLVPPLLMAWLLLKVSGIPMLEARSVQTRSGYAEYMRTTSPLIPWPPRRASRDPIQ